MRLLMWWLRGVLFGVVVLSLGACGRFGSQNNNPGVNGTIQLGNEVFPSGKARYIVVSVFEANDFNTSTMRPKESAVPLKSVQVTGLSTPPYLYDLPTGSLRGVAYVFAFLDQDDSGGSLPNAGDHYGAYGQAINLQGYRVSIDLILDKRVE